MSLRLDDHDLPSVLDAASALADDPTPTFGDALDLLRSLIDCDVASFNDMTLATRDFRVVTRPADVDGLVHELKPAYDRFAHQHPLIQVAAATGTSDPLRFCDVPSGDQFVETDLYRHFFEPFGLRYQLAVQLSSPPDVVVGYALSRAPEAGEFSDRDVAVMNALRPHLAMHHRTVVNADRSDALHVEAARSGWAVITVRSDGIVAGMSALAGDFPLRVGEEVPQALFELLPDADPAASPSQPTPSTTETIKIDDRPWRCVVRPMAAGPTTLLMRFAGDDVDHAANLADVGLTPRQIEVAMELATSGATNSQLARNLDISEGTVKKHLEAVFAVLGVDSRAAAIVALGELTS